MHNIYLWYPLKVEEKVIGTKKKQYELLGPISIPEERGIVLTRITNLHINGHSIIWDSLKYC